MSGNDFLQYWEDDPATKVVLLYTETFGNPRKFARIARRLTRTKPVVAVRAGGSADPTTAALYEQAGVIQGADGPRALRHRSRARRSAAAPG